MLVFIVHGTAVAPSNAPAWVAAYASIGAFLIASLTLASQRHEIRTLRRQLNSATLVVGLRASTDPHLLHLIVRNIGPAVAEKIIVRQDPWNSNDFQTGVAENAVPKAPFTLVPGQQFVILAAQPALGAELVADVMLEWRDGNGSRTSRLPLDFSLPEPPT